MNGFVDRLRDTISPRDFLAEHGKIDRDQPDYVPQSEIVELVMKFKKEAEEDEDRVKAVEWWKEADRLIDGNHWEGRTKDMEQWQSRLTINKVYPTREKMVSILVETLPQLEVLPRHPDDDIWADMMDGFIMHEWERNNWNTTLAMVYTKAVDHNIAFVKTYWDVHADGGRGSVRIEPISNYNLFLDPKAIIRDGKLSCKYAIHRFDMTRNEILSKYGVDPEGEYQQKMSANFENNVKRERPAWYLSRANELGIGGNTPVGGGASKSFTTQRSPKQAEKKNNYEVWECWFWDDSRVERQEFDNYEGGIPPLKYPNGRVVTVANGYELYDGENVLGFNPFVPICDSPDIDRIYNPSMINQIAGVQYELNESRSQLNDHRRLCSNPVKRITGMSSIQQETATNKPGSTYVTYDVDGGFEWVIPPPLGTEVLQSSMLANDDMDDISGMHDVSRGEEPSQAKSGIAIERLQTSGKTRSNLRSLYFDSSLKVIMANVISMFLDFVEQSRQYRFIDQKTYQMEYGEFNPEDITLPKRASMIEPLQQEQQLLAGQLAYMRTNEPLASIEVEPHIIQRVEMIDNEIRAINEQPAHELVSFDISIQAGTRNLTHTALISQVFQAYELGLVNDFYLLKTMNLPGWQKAYAMMQEEKAEAAQQEDKAIQEEHEREIDKIETKGEVDMDLAETEGEIEAELKEIDADNQIQIDRADARNQIMVDAEEAKHKLKIERIKAEVAARRQARQQKKAA